MLIVKIHIIAHCQSTTGKVQQVVGIPWVTALSIALSAFCNHPTSAFPIQSWESICTFICIHICVSVGVRIFYTLWSLDWRHFCPVFPSWESHLLQVTELDIGLVCLDPRLKLLSQGEHVNLRLLLLLYSSPLCIVRTGTKKAQQRGQAHRADNLRSYKFSPQHNNDSMQT